MESFVYCWTDNKTGKLYIGSHKGDPMDGYICSSKLMLEEYNLRPEDFTRQIIAEGKTEDIRKLEYKILTSLNAADDENFYNKHNGFGSYLTEDIKKKIGKKTKELWRNDEFKKKVSARMKLAWKNMDPIKKEKMSQKCRAIQMGQPKSEQHKLSMRGKRPHVSQTGSNNNNAVSIETPYGNFGSIKEASVALNMKYDAVWYNLKVQKLGWSRT
jgi:hypothetical protein